MLGSKISNDPENICSFLNAFEVEEGREHKEDHRMWEKARQVGLNYRIVMVICSPEGSFSLEGG